MEAAERALALIVDFGKAMLENGSEVKRVEDSVGRIGRAYGAERMDVFAITSSLVVTMNLADGRAHTISRRISGASSNFSRLEALNELSREACAAPLPLDEFRRRLEEIVRRVPSVRRVYLGSMLAAGTLAIFFGGSLPDGAVAALVALLICLIQRRFAALCTNSVFFYFVASLATGLLICLLGRLPPLHADKIMIGDIMLLIPGIAMTNAVKDVMVGDTISGLLRLAESLLWAGAIAGGFMSAFLLTGVGA